MFDQLQLQGIVEKDPRYRLNAYYYVLETLDFARSQLGMGSSSSQLPPKSRPGEEDLDEPDSSLQHISGPELCEAIRVRGRWLFGYLAKEVFNQWGVFKTEDFGEIVFNMVEAGRVRTAPSDQKDDFKDVFDFQSAFCDNFVLHVPAESILPIFKGKKCDEGKEPRE